jgi:hypothetical protein
MALRKARLECASLVCKTIGGLQMEAAFSHERVWHVHEKGNVYGTMNAVNLFVANS